MVNDPLAEESSFNELMRQIRGDLKVLGSKMDEVIDKLNETSTKVDVHRQQIDTINKEIARQDAAIAELNRQIAAIQPAVYKDKAARFDKITLYIIEAVLGGLIAFILVKMGLK
jgi:t-SNARE complex subunit (syntaxin)